MIDAHEGYNLKKDTCDICNRHKNDFKDIPYDTYIDKMEKTSFRLSVDGSVLCPDCHKEKSINSLFKLMNKKGI